MRAITLASLITGFLFAVPALAAPERYEFDKSHTNILFFISHMDFSEMVGKMTEFDGHFTFDEKEPEKSTLDVTLKPSGIRTSSEALDAHLQKDDFFNSEKFPEIKFVSQSVKVTGERTGDVTGNLTLLGVTKPVTLRVTFSKAGYHPKTNDYIAGFKAEGTLKRSDFGMSSYIPMVGDEVRLLIQTEGVNTDRKKTAEDALKKH